MFKSQKAINFMPFKKKSLKVNLKSFQGKCPIWNKKASHTLT